MNGLTSNNDPRYTTLLLSHEWHAKIIGFLVGTLMLCVYLWIIAGIMSLIIHLYQQLFTDWAHSAEKMIKEVVILLATFELIRTLQSYLTLGRVKVTFILDAALVVFIGELISLWYGEYSISQVIVNISVIILLTILRIITTKYSPYSLDEV